MRLLVAFLAWLGAVLDLAADTVWSWVEALQEDCEIVASGPRAERLDPCDVLDPLRCAGCDAAIYDSGVFAGDYSDEFFCSRDCRDNEMERRAERAHERGR